MPDVVKKLQIKFDIDKTSADKIKSFVYDIENKFAHGELTAEEDVLEKLRELVNSAEEITEKPKKDYFADAGQFLQQELNKGLTSAFDSAIELLKDTFSNAWDEMSNILKYSQLTNANVREQALTYGFSAAQNYAFSKVMSEMGMRSEEDLYYMNDQQRAQFDERFNYFADRYNDLFDKGYFTEMQEFQYARQEFEEEVQTTIMKFFMENKEIIMAGFEAIIKLADWSINSLGKIFGSLIVDKGMNESQRSAAYSSVMENYTKNTVKIDNTFVVNNTATTTSSEQVMNIMNQILQAQLGQ